MNDILKLAGLTEQVEKFNNFSEKRFDGAKKISEMAEEKGGPALLTHYHFAVKLPYYKKALEGKMDFEKSKEEYKELCEKLHSMMDKIEDVNQKIFQELLGKMEVLGELLIQEKNSK
jgi:hypothetical protein